MACFPIELMKIDIDYSLGLGVERLVEGLEDKEEKANAEEVVEGPDFSQ